MFAALLLFDNNDSFDEESKVGSPKIDDRWEGGEGWVDNWADGDGCGSGYVGGRSSV